MPLEQLDHEISGVRRWLASVDRVCITSRCLHGQSETKCCHYLISMRLQDMLFRDWPQKRSSLSAAAFEKILNKIEEKVAAVASAS